MQLRDFLHNTLLIVSAFGFILFCGYGVASKLSLVSSVVALVGSIACLAVYAKIAYPSVKEAKN